MDDATERELFAALGAADASVRQRAMGRLYEAYRPQFLPFLRRHLDPTAAEDVLHDLFAKLLANRKLGPHANPRKLMWRALINERNDYFRSARRHQVVTTMSPDDLTVAIEHHIPDGLSQEDARDFLECSVKALNELRASKPDDAWAIEVAAISGLSAAELADAFGSRSAHAATERLSAARRSVLAVAESLAGEAFLGRRNKQRRTAGTSDGGSVPQSVGGP